MILDMSAPWRYLSGTFDACYSHLESVVPLDALAFEDIHFQRSLKTRRQGSCSVCLYCSNSNEEYFGAEMMALVSSYLVLDKNALLDGLFLVPHLLLKRSNVAASRHPTRESPVNQ